MLSDKTSNRYVFDMKAIRLSSATIQNSVGLKSIRLSQFDKNTTRVVFEDTKKLNISHKVDGNTLIITIKGIKSSDSSKATTNTPKVQPVGKGKVIVIDAGHGGKDPGTVFGKYYEKNAVLQTALLLGAELKKRSYTVHYTRTKDTYWQLRDRTKLANDKNADMFISIHVNAAAKKSNYDTWHGIETYFLSPARSERSISVAELENQSDMDEMDYYSKQTFLNFLNREKIVSSHKLAIDIQSFTLSSVKKKYKDAADGGVREAPFWVLVGAQMPAVLVEIGYITNKTERSRMFTKEYQTLLANGMANGIDAYFAKNR